MSEEKLRIVKVLALLSALLFVVLLCAFLLISLISFVCEQDLKSPQVVDVSPLENLTLPSDIKSVMDLIDVSIFDAYEVVDPQGRIIIGHYKFREEGNDSSYSYIDVDITLFDSAETARDILQHNCEHRWYRADLSDFTYGESGDDRFCISYVREERGDLSGLCLPLGYYYSFVIFQKNNLLIMIDERTSDKTSARKNNVIEQLAQELAR